MSRQQRRQRERQGKPPFPWERVVIAGIILVFLGTAMFTYLFPAINARSYASGNVRVQRLIISRGLEDLRRKGSFEFLYVANTLPVDEDDEMEWTQYRINETPDKVVITIDGESNEYALGNTPESYRPVRSVIDDIEKALKDKTYKVRHPQADNPEAQVLFLDRKTDDAHYGYVLYFTPDHRLDIINGFEMISEGLFSEKIYSGLITGIPEPEPDLED